MSAGIKKQQYMPTYKDESGSETTLLSDDEGDNRYVSRPKRTTGFFTPTRLLCVVLVLQVAILSALAFFIIKKPKPIGPSQMTRGAPPGAEFNGLVPELPWELKMITNQMDTYTMDFTSEENSLMIRQRWSDLMPRGNGVIHVDPSRHHENLQHPFPADTLNGTMTEVYLLSWVHQLHCLYAIMDAYDAVVQFGPDGQEAAVLEGHKQVHSNHCFDYLRQAILCNMDSALEGTPVEGGHGTDGWNAYHTCRSYEESKTWAESQRVNDDQFVLKPGDSRIGNGGKYPPADGSH